jgi:hypothetical protein
MPENLVNMFFVMVYFQNQSSVQCTLEWIERDFFLEFRAAWSLKN